MEKSEDANVRDITIAIKPESPRPTEALRSASEVTPVVKQDYENLDSWGLELEYDGEDEDEVAVPPKEETPKKADIEKETEPMERNNPIDSEVKEEQNKEELEKMEAEGRTTTFVVPKKRGRPSKAELAERMTMMEANRPSSSRDVPRRASSKYSSLTKNPVVLVDPIIPGVPAILPVVPMELLESAMPAVPVEHVDPTLIVAPVGPAVTVIPTEPVETHVPVAPVAPMVAIVPIVPVDPATTTVPPAAVEPVVPETPVVPIEPIESAVPAVPLEPVESTGSAGVPEEPVIPVIATEPVEPVVPLPSAAPAVLALPVLQMDPVEPVEALPPVEPEAKVEEEKERDDIVDKPETCSSRRSADRSETEVIKKSQDYGNLDEMGLEASDNDEEEEVVKKEETPKKADIEKKIDPMEGVVPVAPMDSMEKQAPIDREVKEEKFEEESEKKAEGGKETTVPKKRGRPSNAELEERKRMMEANRPVSLRAVPRRASSKYSSLTEIPVVPVTVVPVEHTPSGGPAEVTVPVEPAVPVLPMESIAPVLPMVPVEQETPAVPSGVVEPVVPEIPLVPTELVELAVPALPVEPADTTPAGVPAEPAAPVIPTEPIELAVLVPPAAPDALVVPVLPTDPVEPVAAAAVEPVVKVEEDAIVPEEGSLCPTEAHRSASEVTPVVKQDYENLDSWGLELEDDGEEEDEVAVPPKEETPKETEPAEGVIPVEQGDPVVLQPPIDKEVKEEMIEEEFEKMENKDQAVVQPALEKRGIKRKDPANEQSCSCSALPHSGERPSRTRKPPKWMTSGDEIIILEGPVAKRASISAEASILAERFATDDSALDDQVTSSAGGPNKKSKKDEIVYSPLPVEGAIEAPVESGSSRKRKSKKDEIVFPPSKKSTPITGNAVATAAPPVDSASEAPVESGSSRKRKQNLGKLADKPEKPVVVASTKSSEESKGGLGSLPDFLHEEEQKMFFGALKEEKQDDGSSSYECGHCNKKMPSEEKAQRHMVSHVRAARFKCKLCDAGAFYIDDMRKHLQYRGCSNLDKAPPGILEDPGEYPAVTEENADTLISVMYDQKPGQYILISGEIVSIMNHRPHIPDLAIEERMLGPYRLPATWERMARRNQPGTSSAASSHELPPDMSVLSEEGPK